MRHLKRRAFFPRYDAADAPLLLLFLPTCQPPPIIKSPPSSLWVVFPSLFPSTRLSRRRPRFRRKGEAAVMVQSLESTNRMEILVKSAVSCFCPFFVGKAIQLLGINITIKSSIQFGDEALSPPPSAVIQSSADPSPSTRSSPQIFFSCSNCDGDVFFFFPTGNRG